ncbi:hypothetical protein [Streptomyces sp. NPDC059564]|uniref:hypothetical protein n=1 Tax=Streptomyces sp. NPDC059564 TaxID=3346865 RepID=UPI003673AB30
MVRRETANLREQIDKLCAALATAERERDRWACTRETVLALAREDDPEAGSPARTPVTPAYPQIIAVFTSGAGRLRVREVCRALGSGIDPRHTEGMRSKLKKLVARGVLTEPEAGSFALATKPGVQGERPWTAVGMRYRRLDRRIAVAAPPSGPVWAGHSRKPSWAGLSVSFFELATDRVIATERASVSSGRLQHPVPAAW